jgi:ubiquinone/menaquinone biosynthesis C-methylase UbiE
LSRAKGFIYSFIVAPLKRYRKERFDRKYFQAYRELSETEKESYFKKAAAYTDHFKPSNVLDAGCGTGLLVKGFLKKGVDARGLEISKEALEHPEPGTGDRLRQGSILSIPYPDSHFDLVVCSDVLEHIPVRECGYALAELFRVTKKNLVCSICLWHDGNAARDPTHINLHSRQWWVKKFKAAGIRILPAPDHVPLLRGSFIAGK